MNRSRSPLTAQQRRSIRSLASNLDDSTLRETAKNQRQQSAMQQAQAMLWTRLDKFRRHRKRDNA